MDGSNKAYYWICEAYLLSGNDGWKNSNLCNPGLRFVVHTNQWLRTKNQEPSHGYIKDVAKMTF